MSEGTRLRDSWLDALRNAQTRLRELLVTSASTSSQWRAVAVRPSRDNSIGPSNGRIAEPRPLSPPSLSVGSSPKGKSKASALPPPDLSDVVVHRRPSRDGDIYRAVLDIPLPNLGTGSDSDSPRDPATAALLSLDAWAAVLSTPELRREYDPVVQDGRIIEMFDPDTRIARTDFALGWPANPRDAVTISKSYADSSTLLDICTSLPRSADAPAYLRPAPPFVRSHVHLYAWCIQIVSSSSESSSRAVPTKIRITCFWQHDLKAIWGVGNSIHQHLPAMLVGLVRTVQTHGPRMPHLHGYGRGVALAHVDFQGPRQLLTLEYSITSDDHEDDSSAASSASSIDDGLRALREFRRLEQSIECVLPSDPSWDVRVTTRASSTTLPSPHFVAQATQSTTPSSPYIDEPITLRISHPRPQENTVLKVTVSIEPSARLSSSPKSRTLRVNGTSQAIHSIESRDPTSFSSPFVSPERKETASRDILQDVGTMAEIPLSSVPMSAAASIVTTSSGKTQRTAGGTLTSGGGGRPTVPGVRSARSAAGSKKVLDTVRRNYIYFTSLLQEPEAKWSKPITEARGVTVTQLNSIDPTLVVYRAEAVFVGVGVWDLLSLVANPGVSSHWNKGFEDAVYLEHVSELTELWHLKNRAAWPVNARDSVQVKTTYKSPTACHVFSFSSDDDKLFPSIPAVEPGVIRTQVDLQGWAIEALSPNTTLLTLLDQSDPKGWSNKSSIPTQMVAAVAGMGEFAIKYGAPPMVTRMSGARVVNERYDHERTTFRLDYETAGPEAAPSTSTTSGSAPQSKASDGEASASQSVASTATSASSTLLPSGDVGQDLTPLAATVELPLVSEPDDKSILSQASLPSSSNPPFPSNVECELRCDIDAWAGSLDIIVDPAPLSLSALRRHKLASDGSGLWLTIEHDASRVGASEERINVVIRKGPSSSKDRGSVVVNGVKLRVDVEELSEQDVQTLSRKKRVKPTRIPLDQPPVHSVARKRGATISGDSDEESNGPATAESSGTWAFAAPFVKLFSPSSSTPTAIVLPGGPSGASPPATASILSSPDARSPMHCAFEAMAKVRELHSQSIADGWALVSEKDIAIYRKVDARISAKIAIHKAQRVIEGYGAEEIAAVISNSASRMQWDERIDSVTNLDSYGAGCSTSFTVIKAGFPFRDRGLFLASLVARIVPEESSATDPRPRTLSMSSPRGRSPPPNSKPPALICVSASYATVVPRRYSAKKVNPFNLPIGQLLVEGWILETLDPYTSENLAIPSTRCTLITAMDLAGSVPLPYTQSHNQSNVRALLAVERYLKGRLPPPSPLVPPPALTIEENADETGQTDGQLYSWQLSQADNSRKLLASSFVPEDKSYRVSVLVNPSSLVVEPEPLRVPSPIPPPVEISRPSTPSRMPTSTPATPNARDRSPAPGSHFRSLSRSTAGTITNAPLPRSRTTSTALSAMLGGSAIIDAVDEGRTNFVVCDLVLDASLYKTACIVEVSSRLFSSSEVEDDPLVDMSALPSTETDLDLQFQLYSLPASTLASNSLSSPLKRYILSIFVPVPQSPPPIDDPLTSSKQIEPAKPDWLERLEKFGAIVDIRVKPATDSKFAVIAKGQKIHASRPPSRMLAEGDRIGQWPRLLRAPFDPDAAAAMETPIASAKHLLEEAPSALSETPDEISSVPETSNGHEPDTSSTEPPSGVSTPVGETPSSGLLGFLGQYRRNVTGPNSAISIPSPISYWPSAATLSVPGRWLSRQASLSSIDASSPKLPSANTPFDSAPPSNLNSHDLTTTSSRHLTQSQRTPPMFSLHSVIFIAIIAFLLGSLLRSLLSPADFVLINGHIGRGVPEWQEIKRLAHFHVFSFGFVIGIVRRG